MNKFKIGFAILLLTLGMSAQAARVQGELGWLERVALSVPVSGVVQSVPVAAGQAVEPGEPLLSLDLAVFKAAVAAAAARVTASEGARAEAEREFQRAEELYERTVLSDRDLQLAQLAFEQADADWQTARAEQAQARFNLRHARIEAPYAAWVLAVATAPGEVLIQEQTATPLITIARRDAMQVSLQMSADQLAAITLGDRLSVEINGKQHQATVQSLGLEAIDGRYPVMLKVIVPAGERWLAGQAVEVDLP